MSERNYEIVGFQTRGETRWRVVDKETGKVLDDAGGWGYKSRQSAHIGWGYKSKPAAEKEELYKRKLSVWKFIEANKELSEALEYGEFYAMKDGEEVEVADVEQMLEDHGIETDFSAREILKMWRDGPPKKPSHMKKAEKAAKGSAQPDDYGYTVNMEAWNWVKDKKEFMAALLAERADYLGRGRKYTGAEVRTLMERMGLKTHIKVRRILRTVLRGTPPQAPKAKKKKGAP